MKRTVALAWVIAGTAAWLQAQQPQQPIERTGSAFAITLQRGKLDEALAGRLADEALAIADGVFPAVERTLLMRRAAKPSRIHLHAVEATVPIANGRPFDVAVEVGAVAGTLVVRVDGAECLRWPHSRTMRGSWSIAKNEIPVLVEGLCVEPATPK